MVERSEKAKTGRNPSTNFLRLGLPAEHGAEEDAQHDAREPGVKRELVADRHRHHEPPLPDRRPREHPLD